MADLTRWLNDSSVNPDGEVFGELYAELRKIAHSRMRGERPEHTLDATALVHEAWMRMAKSHPTEWRDRGQFYGVAAEAMRRILVESARRRRSEKRGGGEAVVPLHEEVIPVSGSLPDDRLLEVHEVLDQLEADAPALAQIVKMRFFAGLKVAEIAALLEVSRKTVHKHLGVAKVRLLHALEGKN